MAMHRLTSCVNPRRRRYSALSALGIFIVLLAGCSQQLAISVNNQPVFDPNSRLPNNEAVNADLQGCINLAMRQQMVEQAARLSVLSCSNSQIDSLVNIGQLTQLSFLDLGNNNISNITPLENLLSLSGLNLNNNRISDIKPLLNLNALVSVSLEGNNSIPCRQLQQLKQKLGENLIAPANCRS